MTTNKKCGNLIADETSSSLIFHFHPNFSSQVNKVVKLNRRPDDGNLKLKLGGLSENMKIRKHELVLFNCHLEGKI